MVKYLLLNVLVNDKIVFCF